jgi:TetR/AcrR family transcriptional repressor of nem operon
MRGRPIIYNNEDLIQKAQKLFWEKGYTATSLTDLLHITGAGSGSFYNTFKGGKKEVFSKSIQQRKEAFFQFKAQLSKSESPIDLIKDFFRSIADEDKTSHLKGCIIVNTIIEMTFIDEELENEAVDILKSVEDMFTEAIKLSQEKGIIKSQIDSKILGKYLITFWSGLNTLRRMYPNKKILSQQIEMQLAVIS